MIVEAFKDTLEQGLEEPGQTVVRISIVIAMLPTWNSISFVQPMIPTFVFGWPTGQEKGDFLAVDLGVFSSRDYPPRTPKL